MQVLQTTLQAKVKLNNKIIKNFKTGPHHGGSLNVLRDNEKCFTTKQDKKIRKTNNG